MKRDLTTKPTTPAWELVDDMPRHRMLTAVELERLQGFTAPIQFTSESPPCAHFAKPQKPRLA
jgi:hypothetical protein